MICSSLDLIIQSPFSLVNLLVVNLLIYLHLIVVRARQDDSKTFLAFELRIVGVHQRMHLSAVFLPCLPSAACQFLDKAACSQRSAPRRRSVRNYRHTGRSLSLSECLISF
ncbi:Hypothetical_protein [Hexamita inflata]|uniref:Hypothetical_protein n=1 Tax=Hexamita inflata TaxID=28002 RepID=A0AA86P1D5_9EUKA|nr:Hypothetical protein HINF_LOCUS16958 [Hexamita inflata]